MKIKSLEWNERETELTKEFRADAFNGMYLINSSIMSRDREPFFVSFYNDRDSSYTSLGKVADVNEAKEIAQKHWEKTISRYLEEK